MTRYVNISTDWSFTTPEDARRLGYNPLPEKQLKTIMADYVKYLSD